MNVEPDVPLFGEQRLAGVEPDADPDWALAQHLVGVDRGRECATGTRERDEERVSLRADLDAAVPSENRTKTTMVIPEQIYTGIPNFLQQPRRALNVGEQKVTVPLGSLRMR
jgi:hypothetical protein